VDPKDPIGSFKKMINNSHMDLVNRALSEMMIHIENKVSTTVGNENFSQVIECMTALRIASTTQREEDAWDNWLAKNVLSLPVALSQQLKDKGLGYLKRNNANLLMPESNKLTVLKQEISIDDLD
jgi:hypothetical protein